MGRNRVIPRVVLACLAGTPMAGAEEASELPDDALLEFLGAWESAEGEWVDPMALADLEVPEATPPSKAPDNDTESRDEEDETE